MLGQGMGMGGSPQGFGGVDCCECPNCGTRSSHTRGVPCSTQECPNCGGSMMGAIDVVASRMLKLAKSLTAESGELLAENS